MTGKKKWSVRYSMPGLGGVLATAGGLVFNGDINRCRQARMTRTRGTCCGTSTQASGVPRWDCQLFPPAVSSTSSYLLGSVSHAVDFLPAAFPDLRKVNGGSALIAFTVD